MLKILTLAGTRPELIRLSSSIKALDNAFDHTLVFVTQNFDPCLSTIFFEDLAIRTPDHILDITNSTPAIFLAEALSRFDPLLEDLKPDAVLILGDTNTSLLTILAKKRRIPIFHIEAGNRCHDSRVPEETNRKIVDHISDINITYSQVAKYNLLSEGISPDRVICLGSPLMEVINENIKSIEASTILSRLHLKPQAYVLVSIHRQENTTPDRLCSIFSLLTTIYSSYSYPIIFSLHPRTKAVIDASKIVIPSFVQLCDPFKFTDYIHLQQNSLFVCSDSGSLTEESSILQFPALNVRSTQERHEAFESPSAILTDINEETVLSSLRYLLNNSCKSLPHPDYNVPSFAHNLVKVILSHTHYVNTYTYFNS